MSSEKCIIDTSGKCIIITIDNVSGIDAFDIIAVLEQSLQHICPDAKYSILYEDTNTISSFKTETESE